MVIISHSLINAPLLVKKTIFQHKKKNKLLLPMLAKSLIFLFLLQIFLISLKTIRSESLLKENNNKIASKIVFNDTEKTVWEMILEPGEEFAFHTHVHDYLFYVIEGSTIEALDSNGDLIASITANAGEVLSFKIDGEFLVSQQVTIPRSHGVRNVGTSR